LNNLALFRKLAPQNNVAPVLKSNAYGHGLREVAHILRGEKNLPFIVVDSFFEAVALRSFGIRDKILIIGYSRPETILGNRLRDIIFTISSVETLRGIEDTDSVISIHLKIDTGMRRQGILPAEESIAVDLLSKNPLIRLCGIMSHFSNTSDINSTSLESQINVWKKTVEYFKSQFSNIKYFHISATDGHWIDHDLDANCSRLGLGLYGLGNMRGMALKPILEMKTLISGIKTLRRDETVGYDNTFKATRDMRIANIPAGYYEGIDRRLSNKGYIGVGDLNTPCPIIGRVSMNITTIDISHMNEVSIGTPVTVISSDPTAKNSINSIAKLCGTIPYEIVVHIPTELKRVIVD
jgi:alanine racemase